jgi:hypothetical protein
MSAPPDENNLKKWLGKTKFEEAEREEEKAKREREKDEARRAKAERGPPWSGEMWQAAAAAGRAGKTKPESQHPIIVNNSTGLFMTPQKLQEIVDLPSLPDVRRTTKTSLSGPKTEEEANIKNPNPEKVQYCHVKWDQFRRVQEYSDGEIVIVWIQGKKRYAWQAHSVKQKNGSTE